MKEGASKSTDLQHQLEKAKQQYQEVQALQQNTNGKLREAQVLFARKSLTSEALITIVVSMKPREVWLYSGF